MKIRFANRLLTAALAVVSVICVVTAVRIEHLNDLADGAIQRKAEQEPNSKWRDGSGFLNAYRQLEASWRHENGLTADVELSAKDYAAIESKMKTMERSPTAHDRLGEVLKSWGLAQYPLAATLLIASFVASTKCAGDASKWAFYLQALIGAFSLGLAFYRGYLTSLGW